ncbi:MAG TPA: hypothetical protein VER55_14395 [Ardenticatenaceae bacterium]|nr:hypothetical protein [Ardenticatenaceae bacterium]
MAEDLRHALDDPERLRAKANRIYETLNRAFRERDWSPRLPPLDELLQTILSHRTTDVQSGTGYLQLIEAYPSWADMAAASPEEIAGHIPMVQWPESKAHTMLGILRAVHNRAGDYTLDFLDSMSTADALAWLTSIKGVGPKTASLVLLFSLGRPLLPVDSHLHRVAQRTGLVPANADPDATHDLLLELLPHDSHVLYNFHLNMLNHGRFICVYRTPKCWICPLADVCDYYADVYLPAQAKKRDQR